MLLFRIAPSVLFFLLLLLVFFFVLALMELVADANLITSQLSAGGSLKLHVI